MTFSRTTAWDRTKYTAEEMIKMDPYYAGAHFALALADQHQDARAMALAEFGAAVEYRKHADTGMPDYDVAVKASVGH
jgi:hypothetical protein